MLERLEERRGRLARPKESDPEDSLRRLGSRRERRDERNRQPGDERSALDQIFQPLIQSKSFAPAGFIACFVDTVSTGLMVTKS